MSGTSSRVRTRRCRIAPCVAIASIVAIGGCDATEPAVDGRSSDSSVVADGPLGLGYERRGGFVFFDGRRIDREGAHDLDDFAVIARRELVLCSDVDAASFEALAEDWTRDRENVSNKWISGPRFWVVEVPGADPETFEVLGLGLGRDRNHVWYQGRLVRGADAATTEALYEGRIWKDAGRAWFAGNPVRRSDGATFERLGASWFYRDAERVYWIFNVVRVLEGADPTTFEPLPGQTSRGRDASGEWGPSGRVD